MRAQNQTIEEMETPGIDIFSSRRCRLKNLVEVVIENLYKEFVEGGGG